MALSVSTKIISTRGADLAMDLHRQLKLKRQPCYRGKKENDCFVTDLKVPFTPPTVTVEVTVVFAVALDMCFTHTDVPGLTVPLDNSTEGDAAESLKKPGGFGAAGVEQFKTKYPLSTENGAGVSKPVRTIGAEVIHVLVATPVLLGQPNGFGCVSPGGGGVLPMAAKVAAAFAMPLPQLAVVQVPLAGKGVAFCCNKVRTCAGVRLGLMLSISETRPATCGVAMLVP